MRVIIGNMLAAVLGGAAIALFYEVNEPHSYSREPANLEQEDQIVERYSQFFQREECLAADYVEQDLGWDGSAYKIEFLHSTDEESVFSARHIYAEFRGDITLGGSSTNIIIVVNRRTQKIARVVVGDAVQTFEVQP